MGQQLYDPATGTWYNYNPKVQVDGHIFNGSFVGQDDGNNQPILSPVPNGASPGEITPNTPAPISTDGSASDMASAVLAAQFRDWETTYKPLELNLLNQSSIQNPNVLTDAVADAGQTATMASDTMAGVDSRRLAERGIAPTAQQAQVSSRLMNLSKAANVAGAENQARAQVAQQDQLIALGTAPNPNIVKGAST